MMMRGTTLRSAAGCVISLGWFTRPPSTYMFHLIP